MRDVDEGRHRAREDDDVRIYNGFIVPCIAAPSAG